MNQAEIFGYHIIYKDIEGSIAGDVVAKELQRDCYKISSLKLPGDPIIVDIGAHIGLFSILAAKLWPGAHILAFEPIPATYQLLLDNLNANGVKNVVPIQRAVTWNARDLEITTVLSGNSGGSSACQQMDLPGHENFTCESIDIPEIIGLAKGLYEERLERAPLIDLLKIDCEGGEYEALYSLPTPFWKMIVNIVGEIHTNPTLVKKYGTMDQLAAHVKNHIAAGIVAFTGCRMAD